MCICSSYFYYAIGTQLRSNPIYKGDWDFHFEVHKWERNRSQTRRIFPRWLSSGPLLSPQFQNLFQKKTTARSMLGTCHRLTWLRYHASDLAWFKSMYFSCEVISWFVLQLSRWTPSVCWGMLKAALALCFVSRSLRGNIPFLHSMIFFRCAASMQASCSTYSFLLESHDSWIAWIL